MGENRKSEEEISKEIMRGFREDVLNDTEMDQSQRWRDLSFDSESTSQDDKLPEFSVDPEEGVTPSTQESAPEPRPSPTLVGNSEQPNPQGQTSPSPFNDEATHHCSDLDQMNLMPNDPRSPPREEKEPQSLVGNDKEVIGDQVITSRKEVGHLGKRPPLEEFSLPEDEDSEDQMGKPKKHVSGGQSVSSQGGETMLMEIAKEQGKVVPQTPKVKFKEVRLNKFNNTQQLALRICQEYKDNKNKNLLIWIYLLKLPRFSRIDLKEFEDKDFFKDSPEISANLSDKKKVVEICLQNLLDDNEKPFAK